MRSEDVLTKRGSDLHTPHTYPPWPVTMKAFRSYF